MKSMIVWMIGACLSVSLAWAGDEGRPVGVHSLRGERAIDAPSAPTEAKAWRDGQGKIARNYPEQPPLVPHSIEGLTIDRSGNACLMCHDWRSEMPGATHVAVSHFVTRDGHALAAISPRRYFCTQCHVPQSEAKPLVGNRFSSLLVD